MSTPPPSTSSERLNIFKGLRFFLHGANPGMTKSSIKRLVEQGGGKVIGEIDDDKLSHVILGAQTWCVASLSSSVDNGGTATTRYWIIEWGCY
jgi:NAD-dependent DNA ligase